MSDLAAALSTAQKVFTLPPRQSTIDEMLTSYRDVEDTLDKGGMGSGDDAGGLWLTDVWKHGSYPQLEALLRLLRLHGKTEPIVAGGITHTAYWHLAEWYLRCRRTRRPLIRKDKKGRDYHVTTAHGPQFELVTVRHGDADPLRVLAGLEWLDGAWSRGWARQPEAPSDTAARLEKQRAKLRALNAA